MGPKVSANQGKFELGAFARRNVKMGRGHITVDPRQKVPWSYTRRA